MTRPPKVALLIETSNAYARELLHGVREWLRHHGPWTIFLAEAGRGAEPPAWLKGWKGDGIIARIETPAIAKAVASARLPAVDVIGEIVFAEVCCLVTE
jgi:LacI family transcriptional regulator